ncbi:MAG: helix-turn-helix domain-containing protein [Ectothiorhodospiraceae bacterium]|nr:helix-turn-helix domain-containing protein [Ectothiorhodospiraceae bacterium]MCH8505109.1 helix-turn-helix domain-containing protein [Ectothiorhodospiraceae bacterium]
MDRLSVVQRQAMEYSRRLGQRVRTLRAQTGLTRKELAERSRVSERYLASLELGHANPSLEILFRLATALDIRFELLVCLSSGLGEGVKISQPSKPVSCAAAC